MESVDYGNTSFRKIMEDADRYNNRADDKELSDHGFGKQEFKDGELVDSENDLDDTITDDEDEEFIESLDDDMDE